MAKKGPSNSYLLVGGRDISSDTFALSEAEDNKMVDVMGLGGSYEAMTPVGIGKITLEAGGGYYESAVGRIVEALQAKGSTRQVVGYGFEGTAAGADAVLLDGAFAAKWKRIASREDLTKANAEYAVSATYYRGRVIHGLTQRTADGDSKSTPADQNDNRLVGTVSIVSSSVANPSVITTAAAHGLITGDHVVIAGHSGSSPSINGDQAVTVTGTTTFTIAVNVTVGGTGGTMKKVTQTNGVADLHVPTLTLGGYTSVTVTLAHSHDASSWVTLATFADVTALGAERKTISGQIRRYRAITWTFNGAGSSPVVVPYVALA